jgi:SAM-dependent methyltransferase
MDVPSRILKARKIEALLGLGTSASIRLLEVGTGSGAIASYFGSQTLGSYEVDAVDVTDSLVAREGFRFALVTGVQLPFADGAFDAVISNHVIEHVGDRTAQLAHLRELRRVMRPGAVGYLAVPSRWMLVEPHYHLAFLSWIPRRMRDRYISFWRGAPYYDCEPLTSAELEQLFEDADLNATSRGTDALLLTFQLERAGSFAHWLLARLPRAVLHALERGLPTHVYTFSRADK